LNIPIRDHKQDEKRKSNDTESLLVKVSKVARNVLFHEISHIEVIKNYVYFRLKDGEEIKYYATLGEIAPKLLADKRFVQCHRSYVANMSDIKAIALLNDNQYDCIVLDILLPDLDGFTICKVARTITDTPILFLSCLEETDDRVKGMMVGGDDYITKPCSLKELTTRINVMLRRNSKKETNRAVV
jgi:CheY-like chemotaxis protein